MIEFFPFLVDTLFQSGTINMQAQTAITKEY